MHSLILSGITISGDGRIFHIEIFAAVTNFFIFAVQTFVRTISDEMPNSLGTKLRIVIKKLLFYLISFCLSFGILEFISYRYVHVYNFSVTGRLFSIFALQHAYPWYVIDKAVKGIGTLCKIDSTLGWDLNFGTQVIRKGEGLNGSTVIYSVRPHLPARRMGDEPRIAKQKSKSIDIGFYGDSFIFGSQVNDDETVPFYLKNEIEKTSSLNSKVFNYGVPAYSGYQSYLKYLKYGEDHNVVVFSFIGGDFIRDLQAWVRNDLTENVAIRPYLKVEGNHVHERALPINPRTDYYLLNTPKGVMEFFSKLQEDPSLPKLYGRNFLTEKINAYPYTYYALGIMLNPLLLPPNGLEDLPQIKKDIRLTAPYLISKVVEKTCERKQKLIFLLFYERADYEKFISQKQIPTTLPRIGANGEIDLDIETSKLIDLKAAPHVSLLSNLEAFLFAPQEANRLFIGHQTAVANKLVAEAIYKRLGL